MEGIPLDLIVEILLLLPFQALLRFRCVSKRWRNLIDSPNFIWRNLFDSPNFIKSQLNLPNNPKFVMVVSFYEKLCIYYSELDSDYIENPSPNFKEMTIPWRDEIFSNVSDVVGHCNRLLCCICENFRSFLLLNPSNMKYTQVPPPDPLRVRLWAWGFGYDRDSKDYKVVASAYFRDRDSGVAWIYSLKSGSWKILADFHYILNHPDGVFVNGALHWIVLRKEDPSSFIYALHLGNLEYSLVAHPSDNSNNLSLGKLGVLDGDLYAMYSGYHENAFCYELWVMKEYGLKESWTRFSTLYGHHIGRQLLFVKYGDSVVQCQFGSLKSKLWLTDKPGFGRPQGKPLVYEPSLVCPH